MPAFLFAINPLPSSMAAGQSAFADVASVRSHTPYAAMAMLYNNIGMLGVFTAGLLIGLAGFAVLSLRWHITPMTLILLIALALVPYLFGLQYNLRTYSRLLYLFFATLCLSHLLVSRLRIRPSVR